uniref:Uncharacterized protein n=1 Tax=Periophthalmus magnuspinnatus TaxID=409849 RepID=A0A3B4AU39_9GOBI
HDYSDINIHKYGGYDSDFSDEDGQGESSEKKLKRKREEEILQKPFEKGRHSQVAHRSFHTSEIDREEARNRRAHLISLNAFERHKKFVSDYILYYGGQMADFKRSAAKDKTDYDVIRENHHFLWREEDEEEMTWEKDLAKKYYDKLFKEYCIADLSRYKENKVSMLSLNLIEVVSQFQCGHKRCDNNDGLKSWEVNFAYVEQGEKRNALVKLRKFLILFFRRKEVKAKTKTKKVSEENRAPPPKKKHKRKHSRSERHKHKKHRGKFSSQHLFSIRSLYFKASEELEGQSEADHWKGPAPAVEEKSREEEFDDYFEDMFL